MPIANLTALLANMHIDSGYLVVVTKEGSDCKMKVKMGFFKCTDAGHAPSLYTKFYRAW